MYLFPYFIPFLVEELNAFSEDEISNLKDIFDLFDRERAGRIEMKDLEAIMNSL